MSCFNVPWYRDGWEGFSYERAQLYEIFKNYANNVLYLAGDLHDPYAWSLYEGGTGFGLNDGTEPIAVNFGADATTSNGWYRSLWPMFVGIEDEIETAGTSIREITANAWKRANLGLKFIDNKEKSFYVVRLTHDTANTEYFSIDRQDLLTNFTAARSNSGTLTSDFSCRTSLVTKADEPGSLEEKPDGCGEIKFISERPAWWNMNVNPEINNIASECSFCKKRCGSGFFFGACENSKKKCKKLCKKL